MQLPSRTYTALANAGRATPRHQWLARLGSDAGGPRLRYGPFDALVDIRRDPVFSPSVTRFLQRGEAAVDLWVVKIAEHLVATARFGACSLLVEERAVWLWRHLQRALPEALSCVLMPDHLHIVAPSGCQDRLRRVLAGFTAKFGVRFDVLDPEPGNSAAIVGRMIRYGVFNPVRARLVEDAWAWRWSTLRDLGGACHPVWTSLDRIAAALELPPDVTLRSLTTIAGERLAPPAREPVLTATTTAIHESIRAALRITKEEATRSRAARHLFVQAAQAIAPTSAQRLADELGCSVRTVVRARAARHPALDAVLTCLADPRFRAHARPDQRVRAAS